MRTGVLAVGLVLVGCTAPPERVPVPPGEDEPALDGPAVVVPDQDPAEEVAARVMPASSRRISAGLAHTCAVREDRSVVCWGNNMMGQLGDATDTHRPVPVAVRGVADVVELAAGAWHTCARRGDGSAVCWGEAPGQSRTYEVWGVPALAGAAEIAAGGADVCGRVAAGVVCVAFATRERRVIAGLDDAIQLTVGQRHACALRRGGTVACWGENDDGQLGDGTTTDRVSAADVPGVTMAVQVAAGSAHTCALQRDGKVRCWGSNEGDVLGVKGGQPQTTPAVVRGVGDVDLLAAGGQFMCGRRRGGAVRCWGSNREGELGHGDVAGGAGRDVVGIGGAVVELVAGSGHACVRRADGQVLCWGSDDDGELASGATRQKWAVPRDIEGVRDAVEVVAGEGRTCVRRPGGQVVCWGLYSGAAATVAGIADATGLAQGGQYMCAWRRGGQLACWGTALWEPCAWDSPDNCQPPRLDRPTTVRGLADVVGGIEVAHPYVRTRAGVVLGSGANLDRRQARAPVVGVGKATALAGGYRSWCALAEDGAVVCWGAVADLVTGKQGAAPTTIAGLREVTALAVGFEHACALQKRGTVVCWGGNRRGELGDGTLVTRARPVAVAGLADAVQVIAGDGFSCARRRGGGVVCWGSDEYGTLGDGGAADRSTIAAVRGVDDAAELVGTVSHACARRADGRVACWGRMEGIGTAPNFSARPLVVAGL